MRNKHGRAALIILIVLLALVVVLLFSCDSSPTEINAVSAPTAATVSDPILGEVPQHHLDLMWTVANENGMVWFLDSGMFVQGPERKSALLRKAAMDLMVAFDGQQQMLPFYFLRIKANQHLLKQKTRSGALGRWLYRVGRYIEKGI